MSEAAFFATKICSQEITRRQHLLIRAMQVHNSFHFVSVCAAIRLKNILLCDTDTNKKLDDCWRAKFKHKRYTSITLGIQLVAFCPTEGLVFYEKLTLLRFPYLCEEGKFIIAVCQGADKKYLISRWFTKLTLTISYNITTSSIF